eukprot:630577-Pelagomonas_calceolata.AAC.1
MDIHPPTYPYTHQHTYPPGQRTAQSVSATITCGRLSSELNWNNNDTGKSNMALVQVHNHVAGPRQQSAQGNSSLTSAILASGLARIAVVMACSIVAMR